VAIPTGSAGEANALVPVTVQRQEAAVVLTLSGAVDYSTAARIRETVLGVLAERPALAVIDILRVDFVGSAGLALLAEGAHRCGSHTVLRVVAARPRTLRPVQLAGLEGRLVLAPPSPTRWPAPIPDRGVAAPEDHSNGADASPSSRGTGRPARGPVEHGAIGNHAESFRADGLVVRTRLPELHSHLQHCLK
jgi:anti-sigma B factor antagonist